MPRIIEVLSLNKSDAALVSNGIEILAQVFAPDTVVPRVLECPTLVMCVDALTVFRCQYLTDVIELVVGGCAVVIRCWCHVH